MPPHPLLALQDAIFSRGVAIAIAGMLIVFLALLLISLFITWLPRMLELVAVIWPEVDEPKSAEGHPESLVADETDILAAIGFVLHTELQLQLASEQAPPPRRD